MTLVERAADKVPLIRIQAALGLSRLQDVDEGTNAASQAYLRLLASDPNKEVRRTVLNNLVTSRNTLGPILDRVRDTNAEVRADTFRLLTTNVRMKTLSIKQRVFLLQSGMRDRDATVRKECNNMLVDWLKSQGASITTLLKAFDVTNADDKLIEMIIETLLEHVSLDSVAWRDGAKMTPELAILWRVFIKWNAEQRRNDVVEDNLPDSLVEFCSFVTEVVTENETVPSYIVRQIMQLSPLMDKADEAGRTSICGLLAEVMAENIVDEKDVEYLARGLYTFCYGMEEFLKYMNEGIVRTRQLLDTFEREESTQLIEKQEARLADLKRKLGASELKRFIKQLEEEEAQGSDDLEAIMLEAEPAADGEDNIASWKKELRVLLTLKKNRTRASEWSWLRTLTIVQQIFAHSKISDLDPAFSSPAVIEMLNAYVPNYVAVAMTNQHLQVRLTAMRALGGLATLEVKFNAIHHVELLYYALSNDQSEVKDEALKILFDLVMTAGFEVFENQTPSPSQIEGQIDENGQPIVPAKKTMYQPRDEDFEELSAPFEFPQQSVFSVMYHHLSSSDTTLLTTAVEGFTKLFVAKKIGCPRTLSAMLVLLFDPETSENATLQQSLSLFLPMFAFASYNNQRIFTTAFLPTLRRFLYAEGDSALADVHIATFLRFMLHVTDWQELEKMHQQKSGKTDSLKRPEGTPMLHNLLAIDVCLEILVAPGSLKNVKALSKFFGYFPIDTTDSQTTRRLEHLLRKTGHAITDKVSAKAVNTVFEALEVPTSLPNLTREEAAELEVLIAEAAEGAIDTIEEEAPAKPSRRTKKPAAVPKSSKKLFSAKSRRGVLEDSDDDLMNSDSDEDEDSDDEADVPIRKSSSTSIGAKKNAASRTSSSASARIPSAAAAPTKATKSTKSASTGTKTSKTVARVLYESDDEVDEEEADDKMQVDDEQDQAYLKSAPAPKRRALADSDSDDPIPSRVSTKSAKSAKSTKAVSSDDSDDESDVEVEAPKKSAAAAKKSAKSSAASRKTTAASKAKTTSAAAKKSSSKTLTKTDSTGSITDEEKENTQNVPLEEPISRTGSTLSGKLSSVSISSKKTSSRSGRKAVVEESSDEEFEDSDVEVVDSDEDMVTAKPISTSGKPVRASVALARAAAATKVQRPSRSTKSAEQSKLMKEMSAMLD